jgi:hypothetical protein
MHFTDTRLLDRGADEGHGQGGPFARIDEEGRVVQSDVMTVGF